MSAGDEHTGEPARETAFCPLYHEAVEMLGRRWTGAIVAVLLEGGAMRFGQIAGAVPQLSDRLLWERMKELERRGIVRRISAASAPSRVHYELTEAGRGLRPAVRAIESWAQRWLISQHEPVAVRVRADRRGGPPRSA